MKTKANDEKIKRIKAQYAAREAELALIPQQLSLHHDLRTGQSEPVYTPGIDCPGFDAEVS